MSSFVNGLELSEAFYCEAVAPLVGVLGNDEVALALVMTTGMVIALLALVAVGVPAANTTDDVSGDAVAEPA